MKGEIAELCICLNQHIIKGDNMNKMKIIPVMVPWMISPAYEIGKYHGVDSSVNVSLHCFESKKTQQKLVNKYNDLYDNDIPDDVWNNIGYLYIELCFESINYFGIHFSQKEIYGLEQEIYDTSILQPYYDGTLDFNEIWNETDICPNPKIYEVENSILKKNLKITNSSIKHWLITGHEEEIHILSKTFRWREEKQTNQKIMSI